MSQRDHKGRFIKGHNFRVGIKHTTEAKQKMSIGHTGLKASEETKHKMSLMRMGESNYFYGKKHTEETKQKIANANRGKVIGPNHPNWKGDDVGYQALHVWVRKNLPKPDLCEFCNERTVDDLACITGVYTRDFKNWKYLCSLCHVRYDSVRIPIKFGVKQ